MTSWSIAVILAYATVAFVLAFIATTLDKKHFILKLMFYFFSILILLIELSSIKPIIDLANVTTVNTTGYNALINSSYSAYSNLVYILYFTVVYWCIFGFVAIFKYFRYSYKEKRKPMI